MRRMVWSLVAVFAAATAGRAAVIVYTSSAAFNAAVSGTTTQNFDAVPTGGPPINAGGFAVTATNANSYGVNNNAAVFGTGRSVQFSTSNPGSVVFTFNTPITAFAADFFDVGTLGATTLTVSLGNGAGTADLFANFAGVTGNQQFRGFTSTVPFTTVTLTNTANGDFVEVDNVRFGQAAATPEPLSGAVFGGLIGVGGLVARRRFRAA